jgi:sorting nexin-8
MVKPTDTNGNYQTTAAYTSNSTQDDPASGLPPNTRNSGASEDAWGGLNGGSAGFSDQPTLGGGFGDSGDAQPNLRGHQPSRSVSGSVTVPAGTGESVTIALLPEKEGMFLFQHHNYEVKTVRKGTSVVRRYSDFVWLLDCLQKRFPFRRLPLLPPKRVQGEASHMNPFWPSVNTSQ